MITVSEQIDTQINLSAAARKLKAAVDVSSEAAERARSELQTLKEGVIRKRRHCQGHF